MFTLLAIAVLIAVVAYALRYRVWSDPARHGSMPLLLGAMLLLLVYTERSGGDAREPAAPILLAIAADVSLSMGTLPNPELHGEVGSRLQRVQDTLLPLLADLGATAQPAMISVSAFTAKAETILAWDDDLSLAEEIIEFVLTTGLLTEAGSDLGAALNGVLPLFDSLPEGYRDPELVKFLLLVSDGEQTVTRDNTEAALSRLRDLGVRVIALHVGSSEPQEGLPVYDEAGQFVGFEEVGGQIFSVPDADVMRVLAGDDPGRGLFVVAEEDDATGTIADFIGLQGSGRGDDGRQALLVLLLWGLLMFVLLRRV